MNVILCKVSKRENSTKQPDVTGITPVSCTLKDDTSILNPVLVFSTGILPTAAINPVSIYNYALINNFQRYYFIKDWRYILGRWEATLEVDVLASYKTAIGGLTEYVLRSSYASDGEIIDLMYPGKTKIAVDVNTEPTIFKSQYSLGYFIVGIISNSSTASLGAVSYYQMTAQQVANLKSYMMSNSFISEQGLDIQTVTDVVPTNLLKTLVNPFQYIASCEWFPFGTDEIPSYAKTSVSNIQFGWWQPTSNISGSLVNPNVALQTHTFRFSIYGHPQRYDRGVYMDQYPFCERTLYLAPYGSIPLNDKTIIGGDEIVVTQQIDTVLGDAFLTVRHNRPIGGGTYQDMGIVYRTSTKISVPIQLAGSTIDYNNALTAGLVSAGGALASGIANHKAFGDIMSDTVSSIGDSLANPVSTLQTNGSNGSLAAFAQSNELVQKYTYCADDDNAQKGRPYCKRVTLNTIPGYIVVDTPDVDISCLADERAMIANYLSSGFFYE